MPLKLSSSNVPSSGPIYPFKFKPSNNAGPTCPLNSNFPNSHLLSQITLFRPKRHFPPIVRSYVSNARVKPRVHSPFNTPFQLHPFNLISSLYKSSYFHFTLTHFFSSPNTKVLTLLIPCIEYSGLAFESFRSKIYSDQTSLR